MLILESQEKYNEFINKGKVVIDFYADWCGPCKMMAPFFEAASHEVSDLSFAKLNVDNVESVSIDLGISSIPTMILFENGKEVKRVSGFLTKDKIIEFVK